MPAPALETLVADLVENHLRVPTVQANLVGLATTEEIALFAKQMTELGTGGSSTDDETIKILLSLVERVQIMLATTASSYPYRLVI